MGFNAFNQSKPVVTEHTTGLTNASGLLTVTAELRVARHAYANYDSGALSGALAVTVELVSGNGADVVFRRLDSVSGNDPAGSSDISGGTLSMLWWGD